MEEIIYVLKIIYYFAFVFIMYKCAKKYKKANNYSDIASNRTKRISITCIVVLAIIVGVYSLICGQVPYASDRGNYALRFSSDIYKDVVKRNSKGLFWLQNFLHIFSYNPKILFFTIPFLYLSLTLIAYKICDDVEPLALLFLGLSSYCLFGFYMFKQCMAIALIAISFVAYLKKKKKLFLLTIFLAICFHESAWITIPVYIALSGSNKKIIRIIEYLILFICVIFFTQINHLIISVVNMIPGMEQQLVNYLNDEGGIRVNMNFLTALKGLPYYIITIVGFRERKFLKEKIKNYDKYMLICVFVSVATILSSFMYWMWRFAAYFYFPVFIFASLICREITNTKEKIIFKYGLITIFFILTLRVLSQYYFLYGGF